MKMTPLPLLSDRLGRPLQDLRISVTDRCNFRCTYCMPREQFGRDHAFLPRDEVLRFEEILRLAQMFVHLGVRKIRLTGGEPLLRRDIECLVGLLSTIPQVELALTTNGSLLEKKAQALHDAGLKRLTVSLDALDEPTFRRMTDSGSSVAQVLAGLEAAQAAGFQGLKVNAVIRKGVNEHALVDLARHFRGSGVVPRFIEYMDVGSTNGWQPNDVLGVARMRETLGHHWALEPVPADHPGEVAQRYRYRDGQGEVGFIASVTEPFCRHCTRMRLSTDGHLYTCLFATDGLDLKAPLRAGEDDRALSARVMRLWQERTDRYSEWRTLEGPVPARHKIEMSYIGG